MSDGLKLKDAVAAELKWEPSVNAAQIGLTDKNGVVTLRGHAESDIRQLTFLVARRRSRMRQAFQRRQ